MIDIDARRAAFSQTADPSALRRMQIAGGMMLFLPALMLLVGWLDSWFHFLPAADASGKSGDLGVILLVWFGIGLLCKRKGYVNPSRIVCAMYLFVLLAVAMIGIVWRPAQHGMHEKLSLIVPVAPTVGNHILFGVVAILFFGVPFGLLISKPVRRAMWATI